MHNRHPQSFTDVIKKLGETVTPQLHYDGGDVTAWQDRLRSALTALRGAPVARVPLAARCRDRVDAGNHYREFVTIDAHELAPATGYLLTPKDAKPNTPAVIAAPGHYTFGKDTIAGCPYAHEELHDQPQSNYGRAAVNAGYIVFVPDWWGWGDKSGHDSLICQRDGCNVIQMAAAMYGVSVLNLHLLEADAIVDYLASLEIVDSDRIAVIGNSYGGRIGMWITAFNPKIRCCVSAGAMNLFRERAAKLASCAIQYFPHLLQYADVPEIYGLIAPRPLQLQAGTDDSLITPADRDDIARRVQTIYTAAQVPDNLSIEIFDAGHLLDFSFAHAFLEKHL